MPERILIVEDEETLRRNLLRYLEQRGHEVRAFGTAEEAHAALDEEFAVALVDLRLPGMDGLSFADELFERAPDTGVIIMTAYSSVESVVEALRRGVQDYLIKPVLLKDVAAKVDKVCDRRRMLRENARLRRLLAERCDDEPIARSRAMRELLGFVRQVAATSSTLLIEGESGVGKEVIARALHDASPRREEPFLAVNAAAIPETLVEAHLFGHARGAFTGAEQAREGMFRAAGRGTLFLDEIGELPLGQQAKLLRALETREILPVGSDRPVRAECRVVAATNADLATLVGEKRFRADLYYRLSTIRVKVPPLRERPEDVAPLAARFLRQHAATNARALDGFDSAALRCLLAYRWPGNVRELSNAIERATIVARGTLVTAADLPPELSGAEPPTDDASYHDAIAGFERALLSSVLERTGGDRREAARRLGISLATLYRRIEKLGLPPGDAAKEAG